MKKFALIILVMVLTACTTQKLPKQPKGWRHIPINQTIPIEILDEMR